MRLFRLLLAASSWATVVASSSSIFNNVGGSLPSAVSSSLQGLLSKDLVQDAVDKEIRRTITTWAAESNKTESLEARRLILEEQDKQFLPSPQHRSLRRQLEETGDWEVINGILGSLVINIPYTVIEQDLLGFTVTVKANGTCSDISIEDLTLDYEKGLEDNEVSLAYKLQLIGAKIKCFIEVDWNTGVMDVYDRIKVKLILNDSSFGVALQLKGAPPSSSTFLGCKVRTQIGFIQSSGGFSSNIINDLNYLIVDLVRNEVGLISGTICDLLTSFTENVNDILSLVVDFLDPFLIPYVPVDPLYLEENVAMLTDVPLVNFQDTEGFGNVVNVLISNIENVIDADQINTLVESNLLNEEGVLVIELGTVPESYNQTHRLLQSDEVAVDTEQNRDCVNEAISSIDLPGLDGLFRNRRLTTMLNDFLVNDYLKGRSQHDSIDQARRDLQFDGVFDNVTLDDIINTTDILVVNEITPIKITVVGLNNFSDAAPLRVIGQYTFLSELTLPFLGFEFEVFLDADVNGVPVQELITAVFEVRDINVNASILVGLNEEEVNAWTIGTFLNTTTILDCILSAVEVVGVSQLEVTVGFIGTLAVNGAISDGVNDLINTGLEGAICAYQDLLLESIPGFVQQNVTRIINNFAECFLETEAANATCPETTLGDDIGGGGDGTEGDIEFDFRRAVYQSDKVVDGRVPGFLDFRELLLMPDDAKALGATGTQPYGDLVSTAYGMLLDTLIGDNGTLGINGILPESFALDLDLFDFILDTSDIGIVNSLLAGARIAAYNVKAGNLNTLVDPLAFLQPTYRAHVLANTFNWGPVPNRWPNASVTLFNSLEGAETVELTNEVDAAAKLSEIDLLADFQIMITTRDFVNFPIKDLLNLNCWLALVQNPRDRVNGVSSDNSFEITKMLLRIADLSVSFKCLNCTSEVLPEVIRILDDAGAMAVLGRRMGPLIEEVATSDMVPPLLTDLIGLGDEAARLCPHQPLYNTTSNKTSSFELEVPMLSNTSLDTVMFAGILGAQVFAVVFSETHVKGAGNLSQPLSGQEGLNLTGDINLLNWYRLNETFIPFADDALDLARALSGNSTGGSPAINDFVAGFLEEDGSVSLALGVGFELQGYEIVVDSVQVFGLNKFTLFDILEPIAPQTLENKVAMENLTVIVEFSLDALNTTEPPQSYRFSFEIEDLNTTIYLLTAIDMDKVESLELGQLLFIENILPCLLASAYDIHIPAIRVSVGNISKPNFEGLMPETSEAASLSLEATFNQYAPLMVEAINSIFDNTVRNLANDFLASYIEDTGACKSTPDIIIDTATQLIDFRDLLLPPEAAKELGGSGIEPYGNVLSSAYALVLDQLVGSEAGDRLGLNSFIESYTEGQSGEPGLFRLKDEIFRFIQSGPLPLEMLNWLNQTIELGAFDARIRNLNTLVSPMAVAYPTTHPYVIENIINFGPVNETRLSATLGLLLALEGDLSLLDMYNMFDLRGSISEFDLAVGVSLHILEENLFRFPLRDIFEVSCWLSLIQAKNGTVDTDGFKIETLLSKFASLSVDANCLNCTSRVLKDVIAIVDASGASETFGTRLGFLLEDIASSDILPSLLGEFLEFGDDAGRSCPHHPSFNATVKSNGSQAGDIMSYLDVPSLSSVSLDTILFAVIVFGEISVVIGADNHLQQALEPTDPLASQQALDVPEGSKLIDWTNPATSGIPFISEALNFARSYLSGKTETATGGQDLGVNVLLSGFVDENGSIELPLNMSYEVSGLIVSIDTVRAEGLDFTQFDILDAIAPQTFLNTFRLNRIKIGLDISVDVAESSEPPNHLKMTFEVENVNVTVPLFAAVDEVLLGDLKLGSLLHLSNMLPCLLSATYGFQLEQLLVSVGNMSEPVFEGLKSDTNSTLSNVTRALFKSYNGMIKESLPSVFDGTVRLLVNGLLASFDPSACMVYDAMTELRYVDFRQMFQPSNSTKFSPYGDIIPMAKNLIVQEFLLNNPDTQMPKINDVVIAPFTADQSGVEGTLLLPGKLFGFETDMLGDIGLGMVGAEIFDARVENLDTVGHPLLVLEPNQTRGDLLDNGANFGTQFRPLRFSIRAVLSLFGPLIVTRDEMDIFGELRSSPIFGVLLARIGAQEFLNFPMRHTSSVDCWLAALAAPALHELEAGSSVVSPILSIDYLDIAFRNMRISAECFNCTTRGLDVVPELLEILETTSTKNVLGYRNVELLLNLVNSDFAQVWLLRFFQDSLRKCAYTSNATFAELIVPNPGFPRLSTYDMETGIFTATVLIQLGLVVLAETIADLKAVDPIFPEVEPDIPPGTRLVDFTALDTYPLGSLAKTALDGLNSFLGEPEIDEETGEVSLPINGILGTVDAIIPVSSLSFENEFDIGISGLTIKMKKVTISGLDTFTRFHIFNITGPTTIVNEVGWQRLQVELNLEVDLSGTPEFAERKLQEDELPIFPFQLTIELQDVLAVADTFLGLDYDLLNELQLGTFLRFESILPCIQATVLHLEFLNLALSVGEVTKMQVSGFQSEDTRTAAENLEETLVKTFGATIASMSNNVFAIAIRPILNSLIQSYLRDSDFNCEEFPLDPASNGFVDFRDLLLSPKDSVELGGSGRGQYGDLIPLVFQSSGIGLRFLVFPNFETLELPGALLDQGIRFDVRNFQSVVVLRLSDLSIGFGTFGDLEYTRPVDGEPFMLNNSLEFGTGRKPLTIKLRVYVAFKGLGKELRDVDMANDFEITLDMNTIHLVLAAFATVREESFLHFPLRDMLNLNCWLATIPPPKLDEKGVRIPGQKSTLSLEQLGLSVKELNMGIKCLNCSSPGLEEWGSLLEAPGASEELTNVTNGYIKDIIGLFGATLLQDQIDRLLVEAQKQCPHTDNKDPDAPSFRFSVTPAEPYENDGYLTYLLVIVAPLFLVFIIWIVVRYIVSRRHKRWLQGLPSERVFLVQQKQEKEDHMEMELNELTQSMFKSEETPRCARYVVPFIVVINIGFFLSGHLNLGGRALIDFYIAGEKFRVDNFYEFSIAQSTLDMWHAGGQELSILILLFSGVWPYTKQLITLALWFLPPSVVSVSRRGQFLMWLDILAKWSMIDIFVLLLMVCGFRIGGGTPNFSFLPTDFVYVNLVVVPMWGLYANMLAQIMSQVSSHYIVMYHRRIIRAGKLKYMARHHPQEEKAEVQQQDPVELLISELNAEDRRVKLCEHEFTRIHKPEGARLVPRRIVNGLLPISAMLLAALLVFCCIIPSLKLEALGVIGLLMEFGYKFTRQATREESILSKSMILLKQAAYMDDWGHWIGNIMLVILFLGSVLVVPILILFLLSFMWLWPQTKAQRQRSAVILEILQAWQYVEVYILGIIVESWQLGAVSRLFINRYCQSINPTLQLVAGYGIITPGDAQCFELAASITGGAYLLVPFAFGLALLNTYVVKAYVQQLREIQDEEEELTQEEKLRAFDRTTWDNREHAVENIRNPPVLFTDAFRWTLRKVCGSGVETLFVPSQDFGMEEMEKMMATPVETLPVAETSSSEDAGHDEMMTRHEKEAAKATSC